MPDGLVVLQATHKNYLIQRGFDPDIIAETWGVQGTGRRGGEWAWRLWIPINDAEGVLVSYTSRALSDANSPRYLTLSDEKSRQPPKTILYGQHLAGDDWVFVVEGPTDAWRLGPGAVALLGSKWTPQQALALLNYKRVYILLDGDMAGQRASKALAAFLAPYGVEVEILSGFDTDPGDMSPELVSKMKGELKCD